MFRVFVKTSLWMRKVWQEQTRSLDSEII